MGLTAVSLFAGVGGFDLAMERAGINVVAAVEIDKNARNILNKHFPNSSIFNDVTEVTGDQLRAAGFIPERGIITGGFPCQDLSVAGRRAGLGGARSGLFWEIVRLLDELRPAWVVLENVPGLLSSEQGRDMGTVLRALGDSGYGWAFRVLDAQFFGVPQRRRRVFIVGRFGSGGGRAAAQVLLEPESSVGDFAQGEPSGQDIAGTFGASSHAGGAPDDTDRMTHLPFVNTLAARDHKGVGNQYVNENKLIVDSYNVYGGSKRDDRPAGGFYVEESDVTKTLDSSSGLNPSANQGGVIVSVNQCGSQKPNEQQTTTTTKPGNGGG